MLQHRVVAKLILVATRTGAALQHHFAGTALRYRGVGAALQLHVCSVGAALRWHNIAVVRCCSVACVPCGVTLFQHRFAAALPRRVGAVLQHRIAVSSISASGLSAARIDTISRWLGIEMSHRRGVTSVGAALGHCIGEALCWRGTRRRVGAALQRCVDAALGHRIGTATCWRSVATHIGGTSLWHHICGTLCWWSIVLAQHCTASCLHNFT